MANLLYNIALHAYAGAARLAALRSPKVAEMLRGQREAVARLEAAHAQDRPKAGEPQRFDYWFHAASLGEFEQARPLIEAIKDGNPQSKVLVTFFSPSGYRVRHNWPGADAVVYLPFDTPGRVRRFLDAANPAVAIFVKYEFWANYLGELYRRGIPTYIISAIFRPGQRFFKPWGGFWRRVLGCFDHIFVQDSASQSLLAGIGLADRTTVAGDTRFDRVVQIRRQAKLVAEVEAFVAGTPVTVVAGSSWPADEALYIPWLKANRRVKAIIAPHEFNDARLRTLEEQLGPGITVRLSQLSGHADMAARAQQARYLIIDCFGLLSSLYRYGQIALVGGGFGAGIHNINEAAVYGIPVLYGPNNRKFREAAGLQACGGGFCYSNSAALASILDSLLADPARLAAAGAAAQNYISQNTGATRIILNAISPLNHD